MPLKVTPAKSNPEPQQAESWKKTDDDSSLRKKSSVSSTTIGLEEVISINSNADTESILTRAEVRRSKSRVRSYLKKCKDAIIGPSHEDPSLNSHNEPIRQRATSSWYVNDDRPSIEDNVQEARESDNVTDEKENEMFSIVVNDDKIAPVLDENTDVESQNSNVKRHVESHCVEVCLLNYCIFSINFIYMTPFIFFYILCRYQSATLLITLFFRKSSFLF